MSRSVDSSDLPSSTSCPNKDEETSFEESELNTADISQISGLSKILRADDSIADRVRCLLASDGEESEREKPELLNSGNELPSTDELADRISQLLQGDDPESNSSDSTHNKYDENQRLLAQQPSRMSAVSEEVCNSTLKSADKSSVSLKPQSPGTNGRRSGDGADNEPATITAESSDDIMNVSDATEYSDLPKVVDNPIKGRGSASKPAPPLCVQSEDEKTPTGAKSRDIKDEKSVDTVDSDKQTTRKEDTETLSFNVPKADSGHPSHSTPYNDDAQGIGDGSTSSKSTMKSIKSDQPSENVDSSASKCDDNFNSATDVLPKQLTDEKLLSRIRKAVSNTGFSSSALKGSHTSSEQSIASSIDSLGAKVKNLLREKESERLPDADVSAASNYSEEISNFEKTNLGKYTRQFMPGVTESATYIQPLTRFADTSHIVVRDATTDSSTCTTPITYRLARESVTPINESDKCSNYRSSSPNDVTDRPKSAFSDRDMHSYAFGNSLRNRSPSVLKSSLYEPFPSGVCPEPSSNVDTRSYPANDFSTRRENYSSLRPQYSRTPHTQYSFVTPRRVAWESKTDESSVSQRKSSPLERSAYFGSGRLSDMQKSPNPKERLSSIGYRRIANDNDSTRMRHPIANANVETTEARNLLDSSYNRLARLSNSTRLDIKRDISTSPSMKQTSPKTVTFGKTLPTAKQRSSAYDPKSSSLPEYSFTTPRVSERPRRNITPKVDKENPRPSRSLPTYDQLVTEVAPEKNEADEALTSDSKPIKNTDPVRSSTPTGPRIHDTPHRARSPEMFSPLKPEICSDESMCEYSSPAKDELAHGNLTGSDLRFRSAVSRHDDTLLSSCNGQATEKDDVDDDTAVTQEPTEFDASDITPEPAPLPYVRLGQKRPISPFRKSRSISTEKVQSLLMKEKSGPGLGNLPASRRESSSGSDDDLLHLMETVATKVPLMRQLLKKLYDRNLEKTKKQNITKRNDAYQRYDAPRTVDQSVQTWENPILDSSAVGDRDKQTEIVTETGCQTSLTKPRKHVLIAHKATSPMEDFDGYVSDDNCKENKSDPTRPCAFFVEVTPGRESKPEDKPANGVKPRPVAWYEPYEYAPLWKQRGRVPRKTLGFVDANVQDAFLDKKRDFVLRSWERQEDIAIRAEERRLRDLERHVQDQIQALRREKAPAVKPLPKPKKKKDKQFGWKEMKVASKQKYEALPEVVARKREAERAKYYEENRKRAELYKRRITQMIVRKQRDKMSSELR